MAKKRFVRLAAAGVHLFTALGAVCGLLAALAVFDSGWERMFGWLGLALIIDGIDGTFARLAQVEERLPRFSGERLDLVVDYVTYVFVPALALVRGGFLGGDAAPLLAAAILLSSLYHFADLASKGDDYSFIGFPAVWNLVAFYLFAFATPTWIACAVVVACVVLTFVPMHWVHPLRVVRLRLATLAITLAWAAAAIATIWSGFPASGWIKVLVLGASFPVMFVGWEGVGLCSYLLIGFWFSEKANADAGKKAFIMNRIGDFGFLVAMFLIYQYTHTLSFGEVFELAPGRFPIGGTAITLTTLALFLGCAGKSAQIPLYTWLPDAMAGPTPVSALIHAATMVTAGVYLVARCNLLFALAPVSSFVVAGVGALTALFAATIALKQWDIKKVLAYSTVSQLGYMFLGVGVGAYAAGVFHVVTHAFFKALLFLGSGSVIHALHHAYHHTHKHEDAQDMRNMGGMSHYMPWTAALMWVGTVAIAGVPGFSGFFSKDEILAAAFARGHEAPIFYVLWVLGTAAALLTAFYMTRMMLYTFHGPNRTGHHEQEHLHETPWVMRGPLLILAFGSVFTGVLNLPEILPAHGWLERWLEPVTEYSKPFLYESHLSANAEWGLLGLATVIAAAGMIGAWRLLKPETLVPAKQAAAETGLALVLTRKYYVDEIYDAAVVRPIKWVSDRVLWKIVDAFAIDGALVNGSARATEFIGWIGSRLQTGNTGTYVFVFVVGVLLLLRALVKA